ncbi:MAG: radical SAM protein [Microthrixaceae bacterium]|nr:radical SAM protein [Microthrixaceae bacterium]
MPADAPAVFHLMAKPTGAVCNLDCSYCFFLSKELLYPGDRFRMADDLLESYIRQTIESQPQQEVVIAFQGGEPTLMGIGFFERAIAHAHHYRQPGQTVSFTIQTNGVLIDDRWARFLAENRFLVGISIDGPRDMHDIHRVDKAGRPTFDRVVAGLEALRRHEVDLNVLCTVNSANAEHPLEVYRFLRDDLAAEFIQFIPVVERVDETAVRIADRHDQHRRRGRTPVCERRDAGHRQVGRSRAVGVVPVDGLRRVGAQRRWEGVRRALRRSPRVLAGSSTLDVRPEGDLRHRGRTRAQR